MPEILLARHLCLIVKMLNEVLIVIILWRHCCGIYSQLLIVLFGTVQIRDKKRIGDTLEDDPWKEGRDNQLH